MTSCHKKRQQIELVYVLFSLRWNVEFIFAESDTILVFTIFYHSEEEPALQCQAIYAPDLSSLKPSSGATEGVLD